MNDSQWPRFQVFHQARINGPMVNVGTVHAPDGELALLNARDIFVRRPECVALWVVPADQITSCTIEELAAGMKYSDPPKDAKLEDYYVFIKRQQAGSHILTGSLPAKSSQEALYKATQNYSDQTALVWWVIPVQYVIQSALEERASFFEPALHKPYRHQDFYPIRTIMRYIRQGKTAGGEEDG